MNTRERSERKIWIKLHPVRAPSTTSVAGTAGWGPLIEGSIALLGLDPTKLCEWIDTNAAYLLRKGEVHINIEPAAAHLYAHRCGTGPATEQQCAAMRAVVALEISVRQLRALSEIKPMLEELRDTRKELDARIVSLERMVPRHWQAI